ncbi:MAG: deaminase [Glaciihabitans sp.]|nr:deaminase [Glaciihabitans sp.]
MLLLSMGISVDGYIADRNGDFQWSDPIEELFDFHNEQVGLLGVYLLGRRLYEDMRVWETDPSMRDSETGARFADIWSALPKVVFSRTLDRVDGNARLATAPLAEEIVTAMDSTDKDVSIGGATLAAEAIHLGLLDEFRIFRYPIIVGGGLPLLPAVTQNIPLRLVESRVFGSTVLYERYRRR